MNTIGDLRDFIRKEIPNGGEFQIDDVTFIHKYTDACAEVYRKVESLDLIFHDEKITVLDPKANSITDGGLMYSGGPDELLRELKSDSSTRSDVYNMTLDALIKYQTNRKDDVK